ncbi:MAG: hypothetical protein LBP87_14125 [Planctomycetaceae bacterium]|jgi:hypothetical protein|nr:hypothetical protein [Planctomycetaceae bacterium]
MRNYYQNVCNSALRNSPLFTLNYRMLPFQGEIVVGHFNPTRWVGLAYVAPSGRRKIFWNRL